MIGNDVRLEPLTPHIGAVVRGDITLGATPDDATIDFVRASLAEALVIVIEGQDLTATDLRDFTSHFGTPHVHHDDVGVIHAPGVPEVLELRKEPDGDRLFGGDGWHADVTFTSPPGYVSVLHAVMVPPVGADTAYASTVAAFEALSSGMQNLLRGLEAVHSYAGPGCPDREGLTVVHPVVRRHADTGAEGIYLNRMFAVRFVGMTAEESAPLIDFMDRHITRPEFTCRIRWSAGQVVMWDNRFTLHYPINDIVGEHRLMLRCTALEPQPG